LLKFGASWILPPGLFVILLLILTIYLTRYSFKLSLIVGTWTLIFYLMCTGFVAERTMGWLEQKYFPPTQTELESADVIIMLGGAAIRDSQDVDGEGTLCASPANRLLTAVRLQKIYNLPILLSGGQVYSDSGGEALIAFRILQSLGVPSEKILVESKSVNTTQNAIFSAQILREKNLNKPILVTSAFHMRRAVLNFEQQGFEVIPCPSDFLVPRAPKFHYTKLRPQSEALLLNVTVMQEVLRTFVTEMFKL
jgi:uncharacterized SAM-binding protein YcdF (DUF218 family)